MKGNSIMMGKHTSLRLRQSTFTSLMMGHPADDIILLDYDVGGMSLRSLIMKIQSRNPVVKHHDVIITSLLYNTLCSAMQ